MYQVYPYTSVILPILFSIVRSFYPYDNNSLTFRYCPVRFRSSAQFSESSEISPIKSIIYDRLVRRIFTFFVVAFRCYLFYSLFSLILDYCRSGCISNCPLVYFKSCSLMGREKPPCKSVRLLKHKPVDRRVPSIFY